MLILEAIQGEGGCIPVSANWLKAIRELTAEHKIPLVIDEVQTGFARTGTMFAHEIAGIVPDAIIMSKAIGGGFPLSVLAYDASFDKWLPGAHTGTFRGNQIALVAGAATIEYLRNHDVAAAAEERGGELADEIKALAQNYACIGDVRGRGLMLGVEIVNPTGIRDKAGRPVGDGERAKRIKKACLNEGLIIESGGRHGAVLRFLPPLIISSRDVKEIVRRFENALSEVEGQNQALINELKMPA
jgi:diaminobutyrate-2-oxoglutarate transaminase